MNFGITSAARSMALSGWSAVEIRAALKPHHKASGVAKALAKLRLEGSLAPAVKKKPTRLVINLQPSVAARLDAFATEAEFIPSQYAKILLTRAVLKLEAPQ